ncbi:MAG: FHA domain-containing protein [Candidatus Cohnella colombiensis]|uniref:FHA domain-containing protein n=1 Tax=Candidatus Cohnella colombiensis TaxID=3121368 RepID=A0AA95JEC9_9BACL|nr:MAG: FHA domain-containing protein [Cohnella sp.]
MQNIRCANGHFFDPVKHNFCPHCGVRVDKAVPSASAPYVPLQTSVINQGQANNLAEGIPIVSPMAGGVASSNEGQTVGMYRKKLDVDPVVGWLVCVEGADRGKDYRIRAERNFIGRSPSMDICIVNDQTVSRENHGIVSYNPKNNQFKVIPGEGRGIVYLNNEEVVTATDLKANDIIELGQTKLKFVPFCDDQFQWGEE